MKRGSVHASIANMRVRMKRLPSRHRIAHLRALIARLPSRSIRRQELAVLLRDELAVPPGHEDRTA